MNTNTNKKQRKSSKRRGFRIPPPLSTLTMRTTCPDTIHVPLSYHSREILAGNVIVDQVYNLNSIYDPDRTGVGHQPLGFDEWSAFYGRYRVDSVKLELTAVNHAASDIAITNLLANNDSSAIVTGSLFEAACESPFAKSFMVGTLSGMNVKTVVKRYNLNQIAGVSEAKYMSDDTYSALVTSSPSEIIVLHLSGADISFATNIEMFYHLKFTFYTTFFDRKQLVQS
jgi:hypothetical protein